MELIDIRPAKITPPIAEGVLLREKLFERIDSYRKKPLIWISGPGGAGKTTLVTSYLATRQLTCLWYQVDSGDTDLATFFYYLGLAGEKTYPRSKNPLPLLTPEYLHGVSDFSRSYFTKLFERLNSPTVIVLDNLQEVPDTAQLHQCLIDGLSRIPEGLTIFLISRSAPPAPYMRFLANREMELLTWNDLRLTFDEFKEIVNQRRGVEIDTQKPLLELYNTTDGWAAGIQLLLRKSENFSLDGMINWLQSPEEIFSYFADQFFYKADEDIKNCLLKTAFVSKITLQIAEYLTGNQRSGEILEDLAHRNYFTTKRHNSVLTYEYHPLLQVFLKKTAVQKFPPEELKNLKSSTAKTLIANSRIEEAINLLAEINDWGNLTIQILENAKRLSDQGRLGTLLKWLDNLPSDLVDQHPWLLFWKAVSLKQEDVFTSRNYFKKAYHLFRETKDPAGTYISWAGAVDTFIYLWGNFRLLDFWLEEFAKIQGDLKEFPTSEIQGRVTYTIFSALLWRRSNSPEMKIWSERAESLVNSTENPTFKILTGSNLLKYYLWCCGDLAKADLFIRSIRKLDQTSITPLATLLSSVMMATYFWFKNEIESCLEMVTNGLEFAHKSGIHLMDTALNAHAVYALLMSGERNRARVYLEQMGHLTDQKSHLDVAHYHYLCVWMLLEEMEFPAALEHARVVVERINEAGTQQAMGFGQYTFGVALCEMGEFNDAQKAFDTGRKYGTSMNNCYFEMVYQLCTALSCVRQCDHKGAAVRLREALEIGRTKGYITIPWIGWYRSALTELLQLALEYDIEPDYTCRLITEHHLIPKIPPHHLENWPWPVRIYTLGRFNIETSSSLWQPSRKTEKRPLELLKIILAAGPDGILIEKVINELTPDKENSKAYNNYSVTLHRLRQRLGNEKYILVENERILLNPFYCWVDAWQFDRLSPVEQYRSSSKALLNLDEECLDRTISLYQGEFLDCQTDTTDQLAYAENLNRKFINLIFARALLYEKNGLWENAILCYQQGAKLIPQHEPFYRAVMFCYGQFGYLDGIRQTYQLCKKVLARKLDINPSPETVKLYNTLLG